MLQHIANYLKDQVYKGIEDIRYLFESQDDIGTVYGFYRSTINLDFLTDSMRIRLADATIERMVEITAEIDQAKPIWTQAIDSTNGSPPGWPKRSSALGEFESLIEQAELKRLPQLYFDSINDQRLNAWESRTIETLIYRRRAQLRRNTPWIA